MVIFGATGDLARRKLVPALYNLAVSGHLAAAFGIVGVAKSGLPPDEFARDMREAVGTFSRTKPIDPEIWQDFAAGMRYVTGSFDEPETYARLRAQLEELDRTRSTRGNRVYYFATPPSAFPTLLKGLKSAGLINPPNDSRFTRVVIEKPFGRDLASARSLNRLVLETCDERQVFRIDHYLGKETVQNLMVFRFANGIFEPIWNRRYIDHVQITNAEALGVEGRGGYYDTAGVLRDMIQNHVFQVLSLVAMEPPISLGANAVRDEKIKAMQAVRPIPPDRVNEFVVRGQYTAGAVAGKHVPGYREEKDVAPNSQTDTYTALKLYFDNWRWADVPFY